MDEQLLENIADKAEELADLARPYSRALTFCFELAAPIAFDLIERQQ